MYGNHFYNETTRRYVAVFGTMFNDIEISRKDELLAKTKTMKVPINYAPIEKVLARVGQNLKNNAPAITLPRMSFEITNITYDPSRQLQKTTNFSQAGSSASLRAKINTSVPYLIGFQLNIYSKTQNDALQIVEQIIPYFSPQYTMSIKPFADYPNVVEDVPITITGVDFNDDYEGDVASRRTIIYTVNFDMKVNFYGPINDGNVITKSIPKIDLDNEGIADSDYLTMTITPTPPGVSADSDYGFLEAYDYEHE